jgi:ribose-phosphate pyrophosphokinase
MPARVWISMPGNDAMTRSLAVVIGGHIVNMEMRHFPDQETYLRLDDGIAGQDVVIVCTLDRPDAKFVPLSFVAATARDLGARSVGLVAPYLPYMRQDHRFKAGEVLGAKCFADLISGAVDWLVTLDPHLHRYASLSEIYSIPSVVAHAAPVIADWIRRNENQAFIIGPDDESRQWVSEVASLAECPFAVLEKRRISDSDVRIVPSGVPVDGTHRLILVDDIISSAATMIESCHQLKRIGCRPPICIGVHGLFSDHSQQRLQEIAARLITTNSVPHPSNEIDISSAIVTAMRKLKKA